MFEDVHWAAPSLLDLLEFVAGRVRSAPALFLTLARPELLDARPAWGGGIPGYASLPLSPLTEAEARSLASLLLARHAGSPDVSEAVGRMAEGNPLFVEELAATLTERASAGIEGVPTNVKAIIASRLDALPAAERALLLDASVAGKVFWRGALERLAPGVPVAELLDRLEARDLVRRESTSRVRGDAEYAFKHMFVREVAYATLPRAARRGRHETVARFLGEVAGDRADEAASILAHHWCESGESARGVRYLLVAAEQATRAWAKTEAVALYTKALDLLPPSDVAARARVMLDRATSQADAGDYAGAIRDIEPLIPSLEGRDLFDGLLTRARCAYWSTDAKGAREWGRKAEEVAKRLGDPERTAVTLGFLAPVMGMNGEPRAGIEIGQRALAAWPPGARRSELAWLHAEMGLSYYWTGRYEPAVAHCRRAHEIGTEARKLEPVINGGAQWGMSLAGMGRHEEAFEVFARAVAVGKDLELLPRFTSRAMNMWAGAVAETGDLVEARRLNEEALELAKRAAFPGAQVSARIDLLCHDLACGEVGRAAGAWPELWKAAEATKGWHQWLWAGRLASAKAEIVLATDGPAGAAEAATRSLSLAEAVGRVKYACASRRTLARALAGLKRPEDAVAEARRALALAESLGHPPTLWKSLTCLGRLLTETGGDEEGAACLSRARAAIDAFAASLTEARRAKFLASAAAAAAT